MMRNDRRWRLAYSVVLITLTSLPALLGFSSQGEEWRFTGFVIAVEDGNSYIAKMLRGYQGDWLFRTPYSAHPQTGVVAFLPYLLLGKLAGGENLHLQHVSLFHLFRVASIPLLVEAVYAFISRFTPSTGWRRWGTVVATVGGGLGWLLVLVGQSGWLGSLPLDFYSPETFGFLSLLTLPHLLLARALLLWGLLAYLDSQKTPSRAWSAGASLLALALVQPLTVVTGMAVMTAHLALIGVRSFMSRNLTDLKLWAKAAGKTALLPAPLVAYFLLAFARDPYLQLWTEQNRILSPHPAHYLMAYALFLPIVFLGVRRQLRNWDAEGLLLAAWVLALPVLAYAPHNLQRRLPDGAWVAMAALAAVVISGWNSAGWRRVGRALLVPASLSSLLLLIGSLRVAARPAIPAFRPAAEVAVFACLAATAEDAAVVLSSFQTGNAIPAWAPIRVVVGHGPESANLAILLPKVEAYYSGDLDLQQQLKLIESQQVDFVFYGPAERKLGTWDPSRSGYLTEVCGGGDPVVFEVAQP